jgi:hypothetical protein
VVEAEQFVESDAKMDTFGRLIQAMPMLARLHDALAGATLPEATDDLRFGNHVAAADVVAKAAEGACRIQALDASWRDRAGGRLRIHAR